MVFIKKERPHLKRLTHPMHVIRDHTPQRNVDGSWERRGKCSLRASQFWKDQGLLFFHGAENEKIKKGTHLDVPFAQPPYVYSFGGVFHKTIFTTAETRNWSQNKLGNVIHFVRNELHFANGNSSFISICVWLLLMRNKFDAVGPFQKTPFETILLCSIRG